MYLLYLDDSGSPRNMTEEYFVLGGLCVPENSVRWLSNKMTELAAAIHPEDSDLVEFHAAEIFSGKVFSWDKMNNKAQRIETIQSVLHILDQAYGDIVLFACAVHKKSFPNHDPVILAFEEVSDRFNMFLSRVSKSDEKHKEKGIIILDKSSYETGLQNLVNSFRQRGNRWGNQLRNICEVPLFVDSRACRIVQLADHIAYSVFRRYNAGDLTYFNCVEDRFDQSDGKIHGLVHKQTYKRFCTCPACMRFR
ncbi:MAG: DUF3800 domain-containing protein [Chloroflexi bacterium]|mgnify:CR=1 FL=1|nr:DUF3800 domain-containing protein [Chloroflexota bacterium]